MSLFVTFIIVIVAFIFISMVKIKIDVDLKEGQDVHLLLKILCFKFKLFPHVEKNKTKSKNKRANKSSDKQKNTSQKSTKKDVKKKRSFFDILNIVKICLDPLPKSLSFLGKGIKIKNLNVSWCIATDDAFETALRYGRCCSCFYAVLGSLCATFSVKIGQIRIYPDFESENPHFFASLRLEVSVGRLFITTLSYLIIIIIKLSTKNKKERAK